jgi:hypothetical protein
MFFLHRVEPNALDSPGGQHAIMTASTICLVCPPLAWQAQQSAGGWQAIYRLAYEQLIVAFAPSPFQRALEPSVN